MGIAFSYKDLKKDMLSHQAQALMSEFALIWHSRTGNLIDIDSDDAVWQIFQQARKSNDRRLRTIYLHLRAELSNRMVSDIPQCDAMLADRLLHYVSNGQKCQWIHNGGTTSAIA